MKRLIKRFAPFCSILSSPFPCWPGCPKGSIFLSVVQRRAVVEHSTTSGGKNATLDALDLRDQRCPPCMERLEFREAWWMMMRLCHPTPVMSQVILYYRQPARSIDWLGDFKILSFRPFPSRAFMVRLSQRWELREQPEFSQGPGKTCSRARDRPTHALSPSNRLLRVKPKTFSTYTQHVIL